MPNIVNSIYGQVRVELTSNFPERFINICAQNGIPIWDLERVNEVTLRVSMRRDSFAKLHPFAARGVGQMKLIEKQGLPFFLWRFRKRYALVAGFLITLISLVVLSQFIWEVQIIGNETVPAETILKELKALRVGVGTYRPNIPYSELQHKMLLQIPELEWLAVNVVGSIATVEVRERTPKPTIVPQDVPCNIIAAKSGLILSMDTLAGAPQVAVGETVEAGDLLVSGLLDSEIVGFREVHAMANVKARTWYDYTTVMSMSSDGKLYTGRTHTRYALVLGEQRMNFYKNSSQLYDNCDKIVERTTLRIPPYLVLPVTLVSETYTEYTPTTYAVSEQAADAYLRNALGIRLHEQVGEGEIISADFVTQAGQDIWVCEMTAECVESLAQTVLIPTD